MTIMSCYCSLIYQSIVRQIPSAGYNYEVYFYQQHLKNHFAKVLIGRYCHEYTVTDLWGGLIQNVKVTHC